MAWVRNLRICTMVAVILTLGGVVLVRADPIAPDARLHHQPATKRIAITFDDLPRGPGAFMTTDERTSRIITLLRDAGVRQVAFFVNPGRITRGDGDEARVNRYVAAGHVIADHSETHPHLSKMSAVNYLADIDRAEAWLKGRPGYRPWFRYPFLDEGGRDRNKRAAVQAGLKARGLRNGYVTIDGSDWNMEEQAIRAVRAGEPVDMAALRDLYVETHLASADFSEKLAQRTLGRSPIHVLLLHETDLAALFLPDLIRALRDDQWEIVAPDDALSDPIYSATPQVNFASGTILEMIAAERKIPGSRWYERNDIKLADRLFSERVLHRSAQ